MRINHSCDRLSKKPLLVLRDRRTQNKRKGLKYGADTISWDFTPSSLGNVEHFRGSDVARWRGSRFPSSGNGKASDLLTKVRGLDQNRSEFPQSK
jgi:hypothetical protein